MGVVSKTGVNFSIILITGIVLGYINTVLVFPNVLTQEEFGLTRIIMSASAVIAQIAQFGAPNIVVRFHPYLRGDKKNVTLSIGLIISFIGLLLSALFLILFGDYLISAYQEKSALFSEYFYLLFPYIASLIFYNLFDAYLKVIFKSNFPAFLNLIFLRILWLLVIGLFYLKLLDLSSFIYLYVGCQVLIALITLLYVAYLGHLNLTFKFSKEKLLLLKSMSSFGLFTIISNLSVFIINRIDVLMVGKYIGLEGVAVYSIAFYISTVVLVPSQSISRTSVVLVSNAAKDEDHNSLQRLYRQTALNQLLFCSLIFVIIVINYRNIIQLLPEKYHDSFYVFFLLGLAKIVETGFGINGAILLSSRYYKADTIMSIILLILTILTNLYFIPIYGIEGAALATMISVVIFSLMRYFFLKIKLHLTPFTREYLIVVVILVVSTFFTYLLPAFSSIYIDIILRSSLLVVLSVPAIYLLKLSPEFNQMVDDVINRKK